jgi:acetyltransferase-like isoleucine patch superfamily enzyme
MRRVEIGARSWIGERAVVMADIGSGAMVAAGAVVGSAVPAHVMVAGNPARFVRRMTEPEATDTAPLAVLTTR